ncbi:hypothetical protein DACRYDRAFT_23750 [Dacryopinax primogenitus]|uniref:Uncharacterized protein n=1 Tax=Dacryopinax primogenitus (strain DJM 731) TaxID=1858805 RepID=M5FVU3_DACPD|nr:uncharacterized protein DACRYDRAFT_23750 [Dacryopinax primogenitus]EJT99719.1 hypothetical protein DACRYDRAFT_23750 [Dacryopinax primogenitus]
MEAITRKTFFPTGDWLPRTVDAHLTFKPCEPQECNKCATLREFDGLISLDSFRCGRSGVSSPVGCGIEPTHGPVLQCFCARCTSVE